MLLADDIQRRLAILGLEHYIIRQRFLYEQAELRFVIDNEHPGNQIFYLVVDL
jgi:hypothetical protein